MFNFVSDQSSSSSNACEMFIGKYLQLAKAKQVNSGTTTTTTGGIDLNDEALFAETEAALKSDHGLKLRRRKQG